MSVCWCSNQKAVCGGGDVSGGACGRQYMYPFGPNGPRGKNDFILRLLWYTCMCVFVNVWWLYTRWNIKIQAHSRIIWFSPNFCRPPTYRMLLSKLLPRLCSWQQAKMLSYMTPEPARSIKPKLQGGCNELLKYSLFEIWPMDYIHALLFGIAHRNVSFGLVPLCCWILGGICINCSTIVYAIVFYGSSHMPLLQYYDLISVIFLQSTFT